MRRTGAALALAVTFAAGANCGKWWVKNQGRERIAELLHTAFSRAPQPTPDALSGWQTKNTILARLETTEVYLPTANGWGGGIQPFPDGRILFATVKGDFGVLGVDGITRMLGFHVDMNLDALTKQPIFRLKTFNYSSWVRVTDIHLAPIGAGRYELLVGHHYFDAEGSCMALRLSRSVITETPAGFSAEPFHVVLTTKPCITFFPASYDNAFEGHFSGGRIAKLDREHALFTTGDHGWTGVRGYPAVSQEDDSTLGKVLLVDLRTDAVEIFAKGVRNPQGLTIDSKGRIWETEQGPRGGDELNLLTRGQNYGWPESTYGTDYGPLPWPLNHEQGRHDTGVPPSSAGLRRLRRPTWWRSRGRSSASGAATCSSPRWAGRPSIGSAWKGRASSTTSGSTSRAAGCATSFSCRPDGSRCSPIAHRSSWCGTVMLRTPRT